LLAVNCTLRLDLDNEPQPDALLMIDHRLGGQARIDEDDYVSGAPELLAEVAASSASYDLHDKLEAYRRNGIKEYVVWQVLEQGLDWFVLRAGEYEKLQPDASGLLRSGVFPGLWLDPAAMLDGEMATVLRRLQEGLGSPEHAEFVRRLQASDKP
jgi:Uma2 family endonuclease